MTSGQGAQTEGACLINHNYASVNGIRLHYAESGSGESLVILLHGFPEFWYSWRHQLGRLGKDHHVVAPDMRGYNLSDKPSQVDDYRIEVLVEDIIGLIRYFGANTAAIVGHDWGAGVAWAVAQKHPERVSKLAILQVPPAAAWRANMTLRQLLRSWYMLFFQLPLVPEWAIRRKNFAALERMFKKSVGRKGSFNDSDIELYKEALRQPGALTGAIAYYRANAGRLKPRAARDATGDETNNATGSAGLSAETQTGSVQQGRDRRIRVPTLFIYGEQDLAIIPATVRGVGKYINAPYREIRIADSGHWVQNEAAAEVNAALLEFLNAH